MDAKEIIARRVAKEFNDGDYVNLGIGIPTLATNYIPEGIEISFQSENGAMGVGPAATEEQKDVDTVNAGGQYVTLLQGAACFDSATSFGIIRGGHIAATVLGALEVDQEGNLANWMIPGKMVPGMGGAMDLVSGAKKVIIAMEHTAKGKPKILKKCTLPLTAAHEVDLIITEMCVMTVDKNGLTVTEIYDGVTVEQIREATEADFTVSPDVKKMDI